MWRTQAGERILHGAEARLIRNAFGVLVDQVEMEIEGICECFEFGVPIFDRLQGRQKLAVLAEVGHHLLRSTESPPPLTATNESAVAVLYIVIEERVGMEVENETLLGENWGEGWCHWRRLLRDAYQESTSDADGMPAETSGDMEEWRLLIDCLVDTVLWDTDYLCEDAYVDQSPEAGQLMKDQMGVPDEYFTAVAPDPTDRDLDIARQNIRALIDG